MKSISTEGKEEEVKMLAFHGYPEKAFQAFLDYRTSLIKLNLLSVSKDLPFDKKVVEDLT